MALILYNPNPLPFMQAFKTEKRIFKLANDMQPITIAQEWNEYGVAAVVWEAALVLGTYLMNIRTNIQGKKVLELGSGTGFCGIVASMLGADVTFTDLKDSLHTCRINVGRNLDSKIHKYSIKPLDWKDDLSTKWSKKSFDYVIGADLVYIEDVFQSLVNTFQFFKSLDKSTVLLLSGKIRYQEKFEKFKAIVEQAFSIEYVKYDESTKIYILVLHVI